MKKKQTYNLVCDVYVWENKGFLTPEGWHLQAQGERAAKRQVNPG